MRYTSTRGSASRSFRKILLEGLAPDGGLYMPESYPALDIEALRGKGYADVAFAVLGQYADDIPPEDLKRIIGETYTAEIFGTEDITPLSWLKPGLALLQLSNGPTLAFKDIPLQLLGRLMSYALGKNGEELNILGATSGDTGSAAEYALAGRTGLRIFMLSPHGRMSRFQQRQMYTLDAPNVHNLVVNGTFDDCQAVVKQVNADVDFKKKYKLGAVNSINWARVAAQSVYYVYAYLKASKHAGEEVSFCVPSGNFGNTLAAYVARRMGVPIRRIIIATNENDVLDQFLKTGVYRVRKGSEVKTTSSPSMDIASASNFERLIYDLAGRNPDTVRALWECLAREGQFDVRELTGELTTYMTSGSATDAEVLATIRTVYEKYGTIIDPHTAVGVKVGLEQCEKDIPLIIAETAQPAKFADTIREAIGIEPPVPKGYEKLAELPERTTRIDPDPEAVKKYIAGHVG